MRYIIALLIIIGISFGVTRMYKLPGDTLYYVYLLYPGDNVVVFDSVSLDSVKSCSSHVYMMSPDVSGIFSVQVKLLSATGNVSSRIYYTASLDSNASVHDTISNNYKIYDSLATEGWQPVKRFFPDAARYYRFIAIGLVPNRGDTRIKMKLFTVSK